MKRMTTPKLLDSASLKALKKSTPKNMKVPSSTTSAIRKLSSKDFKSKKSLGEKDLWVTSKNPSPNVQVGD